MDAITEIMQQLDRIERATAIAAKAVLNLEEVAYITGFKKATIYEMTSKNQIPHSKKGGRLFFGKTDIEDWLMQEKVATQTDIARQATTYIAKSRI